MEKQKDRNWGFPRSSDIFLLTKIFSFPEVSQLHTFFFSLLSAISPVFSPRAVSDGVNGSTIAINCRLFNLLSNCANGLPLAHTALPPSHFRLSPEECSCSAAAKICAIKPLLALSWACIRNLRRPYNELNDATRVSGYYRVAVVFSELVGCPPPSR